MRIYRSTYGHTVIPTATLQDKRLSYAARGLLLELLSRPDGYDITPEGLSRQARQTRGPRRDEGRMALRALFDELVKHGYLVYRWEESPDGHPMPYSKADLYDTSQAHDDAVGDDPPVHRLRAVE